MSAPQCHSYVSYLEPEFCFFGGFARMSYRDFLRHYSRVEVCTLTPDTILDDSVKHWSINKFDGSWRRGSTAGGCRNHPCELA